MRRSPRPRRTANLSDSVQQRLDLYALAAAAAGVTVLALSQPAEAKVVYTAADKWIPLNQNFHLDLNHDGVTDFRFRLYSRVWSYWSFARSLTVEPQSKNAVFGYLNQGYPGAAALPKGISVGPRRPFLLSRAVMFFSGNGDAGSHWFGSWLNVTKQAYLGFRFTIKGKIHYGWARIGHIRHDEPPRAKLTGYAYETIPNKPIVTGKTNGPVMTVQPATLGRLALGR
jgi:hypothetical protein